MLAAYPYTALVLIAALVVYTWMGMRVGAARGKYNVQAPNEDGPPEFRRVFRAHMNTLEQLVLFIPALVLFASAWGDVLAAIIGAFWPIGRIAFAFGYYKAADKRGPGFGISFVASVILLAGGLVRVVLNLAQ